MRNLVLADGVPLDAQEMLDQTGHRFRYLQLNNDNSGAGEGSQDAFGPSLKNLEHLEIAGGTSYEGEPDDIPQSTKHFTYRNISSWDQNRPIVLTRLRNDPKLLANLQSFEKITDLINGAMERLAQRGLKSSAVPHRWTPTSGKPQKRIFPPQA